MCVLPSLVGDIYRKPSFRRPIRCFQYSQRGKAIFRRCALVAVIAEVVDEEMVVEEAARSFGLDGRVFPRSFAAGTLLGDGNRSFGRVGAEQDSAGFAEELAAP